MSRERSVGLYVRDGDLDLVIAGSQEGGEVREATVSLDPELALDVSTFVVQTCSQR